jgi:DNA (cytosine-5)-methyltransferase 1
MIGIDIFSGCGGLSQGAKLAGLKLKYANEIEYHSAQTYLANHPEVKMFQTDIKKLKGTDFNFIKNETVVLFGGPPCQGFSYSNQKTRTKENENNWLFEEFIRIAKEIRPEWIVFENVRGFSNSIDGFFFEQTKKKFQKLGYKLTPLILNAFDYGVPQNRKRLFIVCSLSNIEISTPKILSKKVTVGEAILDLPDIENGFLGEILKYDKIPFSTYSKKMRNKEGCTYNNNLTRNSELIIKRYSYVPQGGNWQNIPSDLMSNYKDVKRCHSGIYHRLDETKPSVVIGNFRKNMLIHPKVNRGLSVREAARLQSFDDNYIFKGYLTNQQQQVGNAVPPYLAKAIFSEIYKNI